jgi:hypothetical protein
MIRSEQPQSDFTRTWLLWTAGFLAFPLAGELEGVTGRFL